LSDKIAGSSAILSKSTF